MRASVAPYGSAALALAVDAAPSPRITALLCEFADSLRPWPTVSETVIAYVELVVRFRKTNFAPLADTRAALESAWIAWCAAYPESGTERVRGPNDAVVHALPVSYDGVDLPEVASRCGLDVEAVIAAHSAAVYTVYALGFQPGFAFLGQLDPSLWLPRRDAPRARVPPGSVAIAGRQTGVYPHASPGGWHLLGHCDEPLFDAGLKTLSRFAVGHRVRFIPVARG